MECSGKIMSPEAEGKFVFVQGVLGTVMQCVIYPILEDIFALL